MDYTKYALKSAEELDCMMAGKDNFFVVACNKGFKEFDTTEEPAALPPSPPKRASTSRAL